MTGHFTFIQTNVTNYWMLDNVLNCFTIIYDPSFEKIKSCKFLFILTMNLTMASTFDNILLTYCRFWEKCISSK